MNGADPDVLARALRLLRAPDLASCRLVCAGWRETADSVMSAARDDFLSCMPGCGSDSARLEVRTARRPRIRIGFERLGGVEGVEGAAAAACDLLEYEGLARSVPGLRGKAPVSFFCERRLLRWECLRLPEMGVFLRTIDLRGLSSSLFSRKSRGALCAAIAGMPRLLTLRAPAHDLSPDNVRTIATSRTITSLDLFQNAAAEVGCEALSRMASLRELNVGNNEVAGAGAHLSRLAGLTNLNVNFNGMADGEVGAMLSGLKSLRSLKSTWNECGAAAARSLAGLSALVSLDISFTDRCLASAMPALRSLRFLDFGFSGVTDAEVQLIALAKNLAALRLSNNCITGAGVEALCSALPATLTDLDLSWNSVGYAAALRIAGSLSALRRLDIRRNEILDVGATALSGMPSLEFLNVSYNHVSATVMRDLRHSARGTGATVIAFDH